MDEAAFLSKAWEVVEDYEYDARSRLRRTVASACARAGVPFDGRVRGEIARSEEADWTEIEQGYLSKLDLLQEAQFAMRVSEDREPLFSAIEEFIPQDSADAGCPTAVAVSEIYRQLGRDDEAAPWTQRAISIIESLGADKRERYIIMLEDSGVDAPELWDNAFEEMSDTKRAIAINRLFEQGHSDVALRMLPDASEVPPGKLTKFTTIVRDHFGREAALEYLEAALPEERVKDALMHAKLGDAGVASITKFLDDYPADREKMRACEYLASELEDSDFARRAVATAEEIPDDLTTSDRANVVRLHREFELDGFEEALERFLTFYQGLDDEEKASAQKYASGNLIMAGEEAVERFAEVAVDPEALRERFRNYRDKPKASPSSEPSAQSVVNSWKNNLWKVPEDQVEVDATIEQVLEEGKPADRANFGQMAVEVLCHLDRLEAAYQLASRIGELGKSNIVADFHRASLAEIARTYAAKGAYADAEQMLSEANAITAIYKFKTGSIPRQVADRLKAVEAVSTPS